MGKFEEFNNTLKQMDERLTEGKMDGDSMTTVFFGLCANYLACIADELHKINEREEKK